MKKNMENVTPFHDYDSHKDAIAKWVQVLLICHIAAFVALALGMIPVISTITGWISRAISVAMIVPLFNLSAINKRYRRATIFYGIAVGGDILTALLSITTFGTVFSICAVIATYQELNAHSEITAHKDEKLSGRWHSLFSWELCVAILTVLLGAIPIMVAAIAGVDSDTIIKVGTIFGIAIALFLKAIRILYLKKTLALYKD